MFIITALFNGEKYYYDGCHFTMSAESAEVYSDAFDAILEMLSITAYVHYYFRTVKVEEI